MEKAQNKVEEYVNRECGDKELAYKYGFLTEYTKMLYALVEANHPELIEEYPWIKLD